MHVMMLIVCLLTPNPKPWCCTSTAVPHSHLLSTRLAMWRSLIRRGFLGDRRLYLETLLPAFFSSRPDSFDQPSFNHLLKKKKRSLYKPFRTRNDFVTGSREKNSDSHAELDATGSTVTGETASIPTGYSSSRINSYRDYFFCNPECVSVDENGSRIFISDCYHSRILVTDIDGQILDCIGGSSPGFEDGEFESAMLSCPAASYYSDETDCLYFVDSQNHALRRADLEKRLVHTVHPPYVKRSSGTWNWVLGKLGFGKEVPLTTQELDSTALKSPWHLVQTEDDNLLVIDRGFEIAWIIGANDGLIRETIRGSPSIVDLCDNVVKERMSLLTDMDTNFTTKKIKDALPHFSSIASDSKHAIFADTDSKRVIRYNLELKSMSCLHFSNVGVVSLPARLICPLERVFTSGSIEEVKENVHCVKVLPGRCDIRVSVRVPNATELVSPLDQNCIWCQVRGSGSEISVLAQDQGQITIPEKVGVAQQWFDELDNLAFTEITDENAPNKEDKLVLENTTDKEYAHFDCAVQTSPGTCEVVVTAPLYISIDSKLEGIEDQNSVVSALLQSFSTSKWKEIEPFFGNCEDLRDLVFCCPVHLRIKLECGDYPTADLNQEIALSDSSINIKVAI